MRIYLELDFRRIDCRSCHGVKQETLDWRDNRSRPSAYQSVKITTRLFKADQHELDPINFALAASVARQSGLTVEIKVHGGTISPGKRFSHSPTSLHRRDNSG